MSLPAAVLILVGASLLGPPDVAAEDTQPAPENEDEQEQKLFRGMPGDEGRLEVFGFCGSCHSIDLVLQQGLSRLVWEEVLVEMVDEQQMVPLQPGVREKVLAYLEKYYGPDRLAAHDREANRDK